MDKNANDLEYRGCGDGECKLYDGCYHRDTEDCFVCMWNTGSTTRDFFRNNNAVKGIEEYILENENELIN